MQYSHKIGDTHYLVKHYKMLQSHIHINAL